MASDIGVQNPQQLYSVATGNDFLKMLEVNLVGIFFRYGDLIFQSRAFKVFGMFLIGLVIGRTQFYRRLVENKRLLWQIFITGMIIGIPANYIMSYIHENFFTGILWIAKNGSLSNHSI